MYLVWIVVLGFVLAGVMAKEKNGSRAKRDAYYAANPPPRAQEEYLSIWLTFFIYAFLEPGKHDNPYKDARIDSANEFEKFGYGHVSKNHFPQLNPKDEPNHMYCFYGPTPRGFDAMQYIDSSQINLKIKDGYIPKDDMDKYCACMAKRYDELIDLYNAMADRFALEYNPRYPRPTRMNPQQAPDALQRIFHMFYPEKGITSLFGHRVSMSTHEKQYKDHGPFFHSLYRLKPKKFEEKLYSGKVHVVNDTQDADLLDLEDFIPPQARSHYAEVRSILDHFWTTNGINPTSHVTSDDDLLPY